MIGLSNSLNSRLRAGATLLVIALIALVLSGCSAIGSLLGSNAEQSLDIAAGVSDVNGLARVESAAGVIDFQVSSGVTGERMTGTRIRVAVFGDTRMLYAEDPSGSHLPVASTLAGEATVRRLVMPPATDTGYNITIAAGNLNLDDFTYLGDFDEAGIRDRLQRGPEEAVLIYLYNPASPLALTGATLQAYETPFTGATVLVAGGEPADATLAQLIVTLNHEAFDSWTNRIVDRYLSGRIGLQPDTDLRGDLAFLWSYPVFDLYPADEELAMGEGDSITLQVNWRSQNPDPPPPWSFFVTAEDERVTVEPEAFQLGPDSPPAEVTISVDREGLETGEYSATIFVQPYSDAFGMIEQGLERTVTYTVGQAEPTSTPGPEVGGLTIEPESPREGQQLTVSATGFDPGELVMFELIGAERTIRDTLPTADEDGNFSYVVDLSSVPSGEYTLRVSGMMSGTVGEIALTVGESIPDALVVTSELNVRTGPGYDYPAIDVLVRGDELTVVAVNWDDSWLEVQTPTGQQGWVVTDLVELNISLENVPWNSQFPNPNQ